MNRAQRQRRKSGFAAKFNFRLAAKPLSLQDLLKRKRFSDLPKITRKLKDINSTIIPKDTYGSSYIRDERGAIRRLGYKQPKRTGVPGLSPSES